jgi:hypothetical protein
MHPQLSPSEQYPGLSLLLGAYFNQDWALDDPTPASVVRRFITSEPAELVSRAAADIEHVLQSARSEAELAGWIESLHGYYLPAADGLTARDWLARVGELLEAAG